MAPLITLLTDFGTRDPWVAICKGVILGIAPDARLLDITHEIDAFDVVGGAVTLADAAPELPVGVHLAVVDPGVGTDRRAIAIQCGRGDFLVGPDNGLLLPAAGRLGGIVEARQLRDRRSGASTTFDGRDVFAPAAAHLAREVPIASLGPLIDVADLVTADLPVVERGDDRLRAGVVAIDRFGNIDVAAGRADLEAVVGPVQTGDRLLLEWASPGREVQRQPMAWGGRFADAAPGDALLYPGSLGRLSVAVHGGNAAASLGIGMDALVTIRRER